MVSLIIAVASIAYKKVELDLIDNEVNCKEKGTESIKPKLLITKDKLYSSTL